MLCNTTIDLVLTIMKVKIIFTLAWEVVISRSSEHILYYIVSPIVQHSCLQCICVQMQVQHTQGGSSTLIFFCSTPTSTQTRSSVGVWCSKDVTPTTEPERLCKPRCKYSWHCDTCSIKWPPLEHVNLWNVQLNLISLLRKRDHTLAVFHGITRYRHTLVSSQWSGR